MSRPRSKVAWRPVDGILLLDKPAGMTSNQALQRAKFLLRASKGGHTGSLDPLATGMLPLCFGVATKVAGLLLGAAKAYETVARLGAETDTLDSDGRITAESAVPPLDEGALRRILDTQVGEIEQVPPAYSALKRDGVPLYRLARAGHNVEVEARKVRIDRIDLIAHGADWLRLRVECGSGTYIRSLVRDLGDLLGCGAHVAELRRLWVDPFRGRHMCGLDELEQLSDADRLERLVSIESGLDRQPAIELEAELAARLVQGQRFVVSAPAGHYIAWHAGRSLGRARVDEHGLIHPESMWRTAADVQAMSSVR